jgi:hypothetical protein
MRSFLIAWLVAFGLVAVGAAAVSWFVGKTAPVPATAIEPRRPPAGLDDEPVSSAPFTEAEAVRVVAMRLPTGPSGDQARQHLQSSATVTYHSAQHWRVCVDNACWVAHGPGRYAEPENDLAQQREGNRAVAPP